MTPRRPAGLAAGAAGLLVVAAAAIGFALRVTPTQSVSTLGQTVVVGTASPSLSLSGPGVLDLFGQSLPTTARFTGPVRPRLALTRITVDRQVADFLQPRTRSANEHALGRAPAGGGPGTWRGRRGSWSWAPSCSSLPMSVCDAGPGAGRS